MKNIQGFICMQLFVSDKGFVKVYRTKDEKDLLQEIQLLFKEFGAPTEFIVDHSGAQMKNEVR